MAALLHYKDMTGKDAYISISNVIQITPSKRYHGYDIRYRVGEGRNTSSGNIWGCKITQEELNKFL